TDVPAAGSPCFSVCRHLTRCWLAEPWLMARRWYCSHLLKEHDMESCNTTVIGKPVEVDETNRLISSEQADGTVVYNNAGLRLGAIHRRMIAKFTGQVEYAVMSFGDFLGIGESYHPLPWRTLTYSTSLGGYCVDLTRARLEGSPHYTMSRQPDWSDRA